MEGRRGRKRAFKRRTPSGAAKRPGKELDAELLKKPAKLVDLDREQDDDDDET